MNNVLRKIIKNLLFTVRRINPFISLRYVHLKKDVYWNLIKFRIEVLKPNFILIGAQKAGTTSFYNYLNAHPSIFMSFPFKEPGFFFNQSFNKNRWLRDDILIYSKYDLLKNFMLKGYSGQEIIGEASHYTNEEYQGVMSPNNIFAANKDMKFLYVVRNPIARIISRFLDHYAKYSQWSTLDDFINASNDSILTSCYYYQLQKFLKIFPDEQFKIIVFEEFILSPQQKLKEIFNFLGVADFHINNLKLYNESKVRQKFKPEELQLTKQTYDKIIEVIKEDVVALEAYLQRPLVEWDLSEEKWCAR